MDRKTILAIAISFLFLIVYDSIFVAPDRARRMEEVKKAALISGVDKAALPVDSLNLKLPETPKNFLEKITLLESEDIKTSLTNQGGMIKSIEFKRFHNKLPIVDLLSLPNFSLPYQLISNEGSSASYTASNANFEFTKAIQIQGNLVKSLISVKNISTNIITQPVILQAFKIDGSLVDSANGTVNSLLEYSIKSDRKIIRKSSAFKFQLKEERDIALPIDWIGFRDRYFSAIVKPLFPTEGAKIDFIDEKSLGLLINVGEITFQPSETKQYEFVTYYGPQDLKALKALNLGFEHIMAFFNWGFMDAVAKFIHKFLLFLHNYIASWGICIIILAATVYCVTYPLTFKSMLSMKKMQSVQPKIQALREKHKNNPQKLNSKMMEIYKLEKINPLGGCLPILLQMPVFIGLYQVLWRSVYLKGADFLWIKDLSEPDHLIHFGSKLPLLGEYFNILPIFLIILMFLQQLITTRNTVVTDENQLAQQKMMLYLMPGMMAFIFYKMSSGLNLYFCAYYMFSVVTQYKMSKLKYGKT